MVCLIAIATDILDAATRASVNNTALLTSSVSINNWPNVVYLKQLSIPLRSGLKLVTR